MIYLLDTNIVSDLMEENPIVEGHATGIGPDDQIRIPTIVLGEVQFGLLQMPPGARRAATMVKAHHVINRFPALALPQDAWLTFGQIKRQTRSAGRAVGDNDLWIAATALHVGATLVTRDDDFDAVPGLLRDDRSK